MLIRNKLIIAAALLGVASSVTAAQAQTPVYRGYGARVGSPIDSQGWRYWNGNWDSTCFRTLNYLSSMDACSR